MSLHGFSQLNWPKTAKHIRVYPFVYKMTKLPFIITALAIPGLRCSAQATAQTTGIGPGAASPTSPWVEAARDNAIVFQTAVAESLNGGCTGGYIACESVCCAPNTNCAKDDNGATACCPKGAVCYGALEETIVQQTVVWTTNTPVPQAKAAGAELDAGSLKLKPRSGGVELVSGPATTPTPPADSASNLSLASTTPAAAFMAEDSCGDGYFECGALCCWVGHQCVQDIVGNLACCPVLGSVCYGSLSQTVTSKTVVSTTNTPINAAKRIAPLAIFGHMVGIAEKVGASEATSSSTSAFQKSPEALSCEPGFTSCGTVCCRPHQYCTEDVDANFACCDDLDDCVGSMSWPRTNAAHKVTPRVSLMSKVIAKLKWMAAHFSRKPLPNPDSQHQVDRIEQVPQFEPECPNPASRSSLSKRDEGHSSSKLPRAHAHVLRKPNNYALVYLGEKGATQVCQAKDYQYYCTADGLLKHKGKTDEWCENICTCVDIDPKPYCILNLSYTFASSCLRKRGNGSDETVWVEMTANEIETAERNGEVVVDKRWFGKGVEASTVQEADPTRVKRQGLFDSTPGFGPFNNAGGSIRNPPRHPMLDRIKKTILSSVYKRDADGVGKRVPQVLENGGLDPNLTYLASSLASSLRSPLRFFNILRFFRPLSSLLWIGETHASET